jgi:hypothetical protein
MTQSIVVIRLIRNLRYKLTYIKIFESYMEPNPGPVVMELLKSLIQAQQMAIAPLSSYLRRLDVNTQELELDMKLLSHAASRDNVRSRLRFINDGLKRAVSWYKTQLMDKAMTADLELEELLFELGEIDAAKLWHTEVVMGRLKIPLKLREKEWDAQPRSVPDEREGWRPRLVEDVGRPAWGGSRSSRWQRPSKYDRKDREP